MATGTEIDRDMDANSKRLTMIRAVPNMPAAARIIRKKLENVRGKSVIPRFFFSRKINQIEMIPIVTLVDRAMPWTPKKYINRKLKTTFRTMETIPIYRSTLVFCRAMKNVPLINV